MTAFGAMRFAYCSLRSAAPEYAALLPGYGAEKKRGASPFFFVQALWLPYLPAHRLAAIKRAEYLEFLAQRDLLRVGERTHRTTYRTHRATHHFHRCFDG